MSPYTTRPISRIYPVNFWHFEYMRGAGSLDRVKTFVGRLLSTLRAKSGAITRIKAVSWVEKGYIFQSGPRVQNGELEMGKRTGMLWRKSFET